MEVSMKKTFSFFLAIAMIFTLASGLLSAQAQSDASFILAENEDESLTMWFDHPYVKLSPHDTKSNGRNSYTITMAKNEMEGCQFFLAPAEDTTGLSAEITPFTNAKGDQVQTDLFLEYYTASGEIGFVAEQLIPYSGETFDVLSGESQGLYILAKTFEDTPDGNYEATVTVKDSAGNIVKQAKVFLRVWKFALSEKTECKTTIYLDKARLKAMTPESSLSADELYEIYYDYLLDYRINAYNIPAHVQSSESKLAKYLDNPRVNTFRVGDFSYNGSIPVRSLFDVYETLETHEGWLEKAYFYPVDEPGGKIINGKSDFEVLAEESSAVMEEWPGARILLPYVQNYVISEDPMLDAFTFSDPYINVWCPLTTAFLTREVQEQYNSKVENIEDRVATMNDFYYSHRDGGLTDDVLAASKALDTYYAGEMIDRLYAKKSAGEELWWYTCITPAPTTPYCNILMENEGIEHRLLFWQQKMYDVEGFLYYYANLWFPVEDGKIGYHGWDNAEYGSSLGVYHGDGILIWPGSEKGIEGPVGGLRLEGIRDGIEDFQYLYMYENLFGKEKTNEMIHNVTTSVIDYNTDGDNFLLTKLALGNAIEDALFPGCGDGNHKGGEATCIAAAVCDVCGKQYGEIDPENHKFAENGICTLCGYDKASEILWGDSNNDGEVNSADGTMLNRYMAKWDNVKINLEACDFNGDGIIDSGEVAVMNRYLAKWTNLPYRIGEKGGSAKAE